MSDTIAKLTGVFQDTFGPTTEIHRDLTANDVALWDSVSHVLLIMNVEAAFGIRFRTDEMADLENVGGLIDQIEAKLGGE